MGDANENKLARTIKIWPRQTSDIDCACDMAWRVSQLARSSTNQDMVRPAQPPQHMAHIKPMTVIGWNSRSRSLPAPLGNDMKAHHDVVVAGTSGGAYLGACATWTDDKILIASK